MAQIRAVLFDYGNVLVRWDPRHLYRKLFADPEEMEHFLANVLTLKWHYQNDAGALMKDVLPPLIEKHPRYEQQIRAWDTRYTETIDGEIEGSVALIDRLHQRGVPIGLLSNMPADQQDACLVHCSRLHLFKTVIISGAEKIAKPDPRIYRLALERVGMAAGETLFIDDVQANIDGAAAIGLHTHLFTSPDALESALAAQGLLG